MNTIGTLVRLTVFGESHAPVVGCVLHGIPSGVKIEQKDIARLMDLRRPFAGIGTARLEEDRPELVSGIVNGITTGAPITILIRNINVDSKPYDDIKHIPRPGHADYTSYLKYGKGRDVRGGGMFSGRMTAPIAAAGGIAQTVLRRVGVVVLAHTSRIGDIEAPKIRYERLGQKEILELRDRVFASRVHCHDRRASKEMEKAILEAKADNDSIGGMVSCAIFEIPGGIGEPFFDTVEGELSKWVFSIPGIKSIEFGSGTGCASMRGSEHNDRFEVRGGKIVTSTNHAGGVLGGITTGMPIIFRVGVKPTSSIEKPQRSVNLKSRRPVELKVKGRHDPCIVPRAVAAVEASASLSILDLILRNGRNAR
jgi:chorismate synthase